MNDQCFSLGLFACVLQAGAAVTYMLSWDGMFQMAPSHGFGERRRTQGA